MGWEGQPEDRTGLESDAVAAFAGQENAGELAHGRLMAHTQDTCIARESLEQIEHAAWRAVLAQYRCLFHLPGKLQRLSDDLSRLTRP